MSTKKAIGTSFVAIFILIITQIIAQSIASMFVIIKIPTGICNIIGHKLLDKSEFVRALKCFLKKLILTIGSDTSILNTTLRIYLAHTV